MRTALRLIAMLGSLVLALVPGLTTAESTATEPARVQLVTLGTGGGPADRQKRAQSANAVVVGDDIYLVDAGDGVLRQLAAANLPLEKVRAIFITHHHFDHNADLGPLLARRWLFGTHSPLPVFGPPMTIDMLAQQARAYRAIELAPITIGGPASPSIASTIDARDFPADLDQPRVIYQDTNVRVSAILNDHYHFAPGSAEQKASRSYALRFDTPSRSIAFTGDTGPSARVEVLARDVDVLVSEVIDLDRIEKSLREAGGGEFIEALIEHLRQDHLTPPQVGQLAANARAKQVILSHVVPGWDDETDLSGYTKGLADHYKGPVRIASDLERF
jgi:ribonuclease BN (tRNA processing enzyme)